jgi:hypothetical protein
MTEDEVSRLRRRIAIFLKTLPYAWCLHLVHVAFVLARNSVRVDLVAYVLIANVVLALFHLPIYYRFLKQDVGGTLVGCYVSLAKDGDYSDCLMCLIVSALAFYFHFLMLFVFQFMGT